MRTRVLLIVELLLGVIPVTALYIYMFPAGLSWARGALGAAYRGTPNAFALGMAASFVLGGVGIASLWLAAGGRLHGRAAPGRLVLAGLFAGMAVSAFLLTVLTLLGALWLDYYLYGTPTLVALHQVFAGRVRERRVAT